MNAALLPLLALATAAAPAPVAPKQAEAVLFIRSPKASLAPVREFLSNAGTRAPSLRPDALGRMLGSPLGVDLLDAAALKDAGVDADKPITVSLVAGNLVTCVNGDPEKLAPRFEAKIGLGTEKAKTTSRGAALVGAAVGKNWRNGYVRKGSLFCGASQAFDVLPTLKLVADGLADGGLAAQKSFRTATAGIGGDPLVFAQLREGAVALELHGAAKSLEAKGRAVGPAVLAPPKEALTVGGLKVKAPVLATALLSPKTLADPAGPLGMTLGFITGNACPSCGPALAKALQAQLAPKLSGALALLVAGVDLTSAGKPMSSYYLAPHAYLLHLKDATGVGAALKDAVAKVNAGGGATRDEGEGQAVRVGPREIFVGVHKDVLYVANDPKARDLALSAWDGAAPSKPEHALQASVEGPMVANALSGISILDVARSSDLAALFGLSVEAGPLLRNAESITLQADPDPAGAQVNFQLKLK